MRKKHPHIESKKGVLGGEPVIQGTRIAVRVIVNWTRRGKTVDDIAMMYSNITHAQIHDALSYYYDNKEEIDQWIELNDFDAAMRKHAEAPWQKSDSILMRT